jgi:hypothetical protein
MYSWTRKSFLFLFMLLSLFSSASAKKPEKKSSQAYLSMGTMFKNEAKWLKEWIEFHRILGVEHFYLYNNFSTDNYLEILNPYIQKKIVTLIDWPYPTTNADELMNVQNIAMKDCVDRADSTWIAILDVDEFLFPTKGRLKKFLKPYDALGNIGAIYINWFMYGTSYVNEIPKNKLLIETLLMRGESTSYIGKTIVKKCAVSGFIDSHRPIMAADFVAIYPNKKVVGEPDWRADFASSDIIRINHYWSRDRKFFDEVKSKGVGTHTKILEFREQFITDTYNHTEDRKILRFAPALRKRMGFSR